LGQAPESEGQPLEHGDPFRVKSAGAAALPVWLAWSPKLVLPPGGIAAL
jgi:hypothetical protein